MTIRKELIDELIATSGGTLIGPDGNIPHLETLLHVETISAWSLVLTSLMTIASASLTVCIVASNRTRCWILNLQRRNRR